MRILLIVPGTYSWRYPGQVQPHTGIAYLAGILKKEGIEVKILDMSLRCHTKQIFPTLDLFRPQLIGITVFSLDHKRAYDLIHNIKNHGDYQVVLGGPHISAIGDTALRKSKADFVIKGEGEEISTAVEVAEILKNRMYPGVEIANISLGSRPYFERNQRRNYRRDIQPSKNKKDLISKIEITISKSQM